MYGEAAAIVLQRLQRARPQIGTMDLKVVAMVLSRDVTLSRNLTNFHQVTGLAVEDWTT